MYNIKAWQNIFIFMAWVVLLCLQNIDIFIYILLITI